MDDLSDIFKAQNSLPSRKTGCIASRPFNGMLEPLTMAEQKVVAETDESDDEGDIVPGPKNQSLQHMRARPPQEQQQRESVEDVEEDANQEEAKAESIGDKLYMMHSSLVTSSPDGVLQYDLDNEIGECIDTNSPLYACGGPAVRIEVEDYDMDVMLCWSERCTFCSTIFGPLVSAKQRAEAAIDAEDDPDIDSSSSPYAGMPFVHWNDIMYDPEQGGWVFSPLATSDDLPTLTADQETLLMDDILFAAQDIRIPFLSCRGDECDTCKAHHAAHTKHAAAKKAKEGKTAGSNDLPMAKQPERRKATMAEVALEDLPAEPEDDDGDWEEVIWFDQDGNVNRGYRRGTSVGPTAKGKGKSQMRKTSA